MLPQKHILIVEGNDITRKLIVGILNKRGVETYEARSGTEALAFLGKELMLVVLDVDHDDADNIGFIRKMQMEHSRLPVVAMTENPDRSSVQEKLGLSAFSVLEKPVMPEKLLGQIEDHLIGDLEKKVASEEKRAETPLSAAPGEASLQGQREDFMRRAIDLSQEKMHENCGGPFGAVIVRAGKIIAEGWNAVTSTNDPTAHAEVMAIRKAAEAVGDYSLSGCEIYTSCEPCPMCLAAIYWARLDRIFYANTREDAAQIGFDDDFLYREIAQPEHKRTLPGRMMMRPEAQIVFEEWMKKADKTPY